MSAIINILFQLGFAIFFAMIASAIATPLAKRLGLIDHPGTAPHKLHARPTPLAGGLVIAASITSLIFIFPNLFQNELKGMVFGAGIILAFGLWDDFTGLGAGPKFFGQFLAAAVVIYSGTMIDILPADFFYGNQIIANSANQALTLIWLVGITNAFNLVDSMDGIVAGLSAIASLLFVIVTTISGQPVLTLWSLMLAGISLALYLWNSPPAKYFLGDSGAQTMGFLLAVMAILYNPDDLAQASSWFVPILILAVPIFDTSLVVFSRLRRHRPPFEGNRDHTYHRLVTAGLKPGMAVNLLHTTAICLDGIAMYALYQPPITANLIFVLCLLAAGGLLVTFEFKEGFIYQPSIENRGE
jgi:UDP-GlcNAc:undecaprenyl-phosphate GlcNAc-1-phosphate transferase